MGNKWNAFEELGIAGYSTNQEKAQAFMRLALQFHPDINTRSNPQRFIDICYAYEKIGTPKVFQWNGERELELQMYYGSRDEYDIFDALKTFAHFIGGGGCSEKAGDIIIRLDIGLNDVLLGNYKSMQLIRDVKCLECAENLKSKCHSCKGFRRVRVDEKINIEIAPGVSTGNILCFPQQGDFDVESDELGDLYVVFFEKLPKNLTRKNENVQIDIEVDLTTMALGGTAAVQGLRGDMHYFKVPPQTQSGTKIRIAGQGLPILGTPRWGSLICKTIAKMPELGPKESELFAKLKEFIVSKGELRYCTYGQVGLIKLEPQHDTPMLLERLIDLSLVLRNSGLSIAFDLQDFGDNISGEVFNALLEVYRRFDGQGPIRLIGHPSINIQLQQLQIESLFSIISNVDGLKEIETTPLENALGIYSHAKWEVYPMGDTSLNSDYILSSVELSSYLEPQGTLFKAFDMSKVPQIDSFFMGRLVSCYRYVSKNGGKIALISLQPLVRKVLEETSILNLFVEVGSVSDLPD